MQGKLLRVPLATLFANDTNFTGATLTFSGASTYGVPISRGGDFLIYLTPSAQTSEDSFTYTLTDSIGITATATVIVTKFAAPPAVTVAPRAGGGAVVTLKGDANSPYRVLASNDLVNWSVFVIEEPRFENDFTEIREIYSDGGGNATVQDPA